MQGIALRAIDILTFFYVVVEEIEISDSSKVTGQAEWGFYPSTLAPEMWSYSPSYILTSLDIVTPQQTP